MFIFGEQKKKLVARIRGRCGCMDSGYFVGGVGEIDKI
jgi:hypothetical protein